MFKPLFKGEILIGNFPFKKIFYFQIQTSRCFEQKCNFIILIVIFSFLNYFPSTFFFCMLYRPRLFHQLKIICGAKGKCLQNGSGCEKAIIRCQISKVIRMSERVNIESILPPHTTYYL